MKSQVSIVRCENYEPARVEKAVREALLKLGGITNFVQPGSKVLVKPNLLMAAEPRYPVDTHPEVVRSVIRILKEIGADIYVGDGPSVWAGQSSEVGVVYEKSGIKRVVEEEGVRLVFFDKRRWSGKILLSTWVDECAYIINVPKFKTHNYTVLSGAIKNLFGLVPDKYKLELHKQNFTMKKFSGMLVDIYQAVRPALTVMDGIVAMQGDGPGMSGEPKDLGLVFASADGVALDSVMANIMGFDPFDVPMIKEADARKAGCARLSDIQILGEPLESIIGKPYKFPHAALHMKCPQIIPKALLESIIRFRPRIDRAKCVLCRTCIKTCPNNAVKLDNDRIKIDYSRCIACFCCQESCPHQAIGVKRGMLTKLLRL